MRVQLFHSFLYRPIPRQCSFREVGRFWWPEPLPRTKALLSPSRLSHGVDGLQCLVHIIVRNRFHLLDHNLLLEEVIELLCLCLFLALFLIADEKVSIFLVHGLPVIGKVCDGISQIATWRSLCIP